MSIHAVKKEMVVVVDCFYIALFSLLSRLTVLIGLEYSRQRR